LIIALGQALRHAGDSSGAEHLWRAGIHSDNATCYARTYEALAFLYSEEGRLEEAERMFRAAIAQSPTMQLDLIHLGSILQRQGRLEQAEEVLRQALIVESPNHRAWAYDSLSAVYQQQQRWHEAIEASQAAIALAPGSIHYYHRLIEIYHSTGRLQDKTQACETVRKLPDNAEIPATCR
jgi:tetratricopeptide (TPR) repeat protein